VVPNLNAYAERWVQSAQQECLDYFHVFGERHLLHLLAEYVEHFNHERPHQAIGNRPPCGHNPPPMNSVPTVGCERRLGGLLRHYVWREA
jgi:putative transposase